MKESFFFSRVAAFTFEFWVYLSKGIRFLWKIVIIVDTFVGETEHICRCLPFSDYMKAH